MREHAIIAIPHKNRLLDFTIAYRRTPRNGYQIHTIRKGFRLCATSDVSWNMMLIDKHIDKDKGNGTGWTPGSALPRGLQRHQNLVSCGIESYNPHFVWPAPCGTGMAPRPGTLQRSLIDIPQFEA